jgi:hypothetical protein
VQKMRFYSTVAAGTGLLTLSSFIQSTYSIPPSHVVDLTVEGISIQTKINVQICSGLMNRDENDITVYTLMEEPYDSDWLADAEGVTNPELTSTNSLLSTCTAQKDLVKGYILYDYVSQQVLVPNLITLASVMDALLLESSDEMTQTLPLLFDSVTTWKGYNAVNSTAYMYEHHIDSTSTLAWMNPGYDQHQDPKNPPLTHDLNPKLIDYIVKTKIFNFYMNDACIKGTDDYELMSQIAVNNPWPRYTFHLIPVTDSSQTNPCLWLQRCLSHRR